MSVHFFVETVQVIITVLALTMGSKLLLNEAISPIIGQL